MESSDSFRGIDERKTKVPKWGWASRPSGPDAVASLENPPLLPRDILVLLLPRLRDMRSTRAGGHRITDSGAKSAGLGGSLCPWEFHSVLVRADTTPDWVCADLGHTVSLGTHGRVIDWEVTDPGARR